MDISPEPEWDKLIRLLRLEQGVVMLLGETDSGKTTLARYLVESLVKMHQPVALVDSDVGQSGIGLPGTISMKVFQSEKDLEDFGYERMIFLGFTSPAKMISLMIDKTRQMTTIARRRACIAVLDTTGLVSGELGKALKVAKIRAIRPAHVVAIQRRDELKHILSLIEDARIYRLKTSPETRRRSLAARRAYRRKRLQEYFRAREQHERIIDTSAVRFLYRGRMVPFGEEEMVDGAVVGLNRYNSTIALGVVEGVEGSSIFLRSPLRLLRGINEVVYGDITMS